MGTFVSKKCKDVHDESEKESMNEYIKSLEEQIVKLKTSKMSESDGLTLTSLDTTELRNISEQRISSIVESMLEDPDTNIPWLPDFVERKLYMNIFTIAMNMLERIIEDIKLHFMGHQIQMVVDPILKS